MKNILSIIIIRSTIRSYSGWWITIAIIRLMSSGVIAHCWLAFLSIRLAFNVCLDVKLFGDRLHWLLITWVGVLIQRNIALIILLSLHLIISVRIFLLFASLILLYQIIWGLLISRTYAITYLLFFRNDCFLIFNFLWLLWHLKLNAFNALSVFITIFKSRIVTVRIDGNSKFFILDN